MKQEFDLDWRALRGFDAVMGRMGHLRRRERLPHVLLIEGHAGIGKYRLAAAAAAMYVCQDGSACGQCDACVDVRCGRHDDVLWLQTDEDRIKVDQATSIQTHLSYHPQGARNAFLPVRLAVAIDIDKLSLQASNRLLKTLEEPPPFARLILTTSRYQSLLETIRSRCVKWHVRLPTELAGDPVADVDPALAERLLQFFALEADGRAIAMAQDIIKEFGLSAASVARTSELVLNRYYRQLLIDQGSEARPRPPVRRLRCRREHLRQLHQRAVREHIALNAQLSMESLAMNF